MNETVEKKFKKKKSKEEIRFQNWLDSKGFIYKKDYFVDFDIELDSLTKSGRQFEKTFVDIAFPNQKIAISLEGLNHGMVGSFDKDIRISNSLQRQGWKYYRLSNKKVAYICNNNILEKELLWLQQALQLVKMTNNNNSTREEALTI